MQFGLFSCNWVLQSIFCYVLHVCVCVGVCTRQGPVWWWWRRSFHHSQAAAAGFLSWPLSQAAALPPDGTHCGNNCRMTETQRWDKSHQLQLYSVYTADTHAVFLPFQQDDKMWSLRFKKAMTVVNCTHLRCTSTDFFWFWNLLIPHIPYVIMDLSFTMLHFFFS